MADYGDASALFPVYDDASLFVDDVLMPITGIRHQHSGKVAICVEFEARADDGQDLLGSLYTTQARGDVVAIVNAALDQGRRIEIRGKQAVTCVPGTKRFWVVGTIQIAGSAGGLAGGCPMMGTLN